MIVAEQKPFNEIFHYAVKNNKILVLGCGTCVTVCMAGGEHEVKVLSNQLRLAARKKNYEIEVFELTITRQCDKEFYDDETARRIMESDAVISLGCGVGVQQITEWLPDSFVYPGLNTKLMGTTVEQGIWSEKCTCCGECILDKFGGICPIARCSKSLLNGPCGGSVNGMCEVDPENTECAWQLIFDRLKKLGQLENLMKFQPAKDWSTSRDGGPRKVIREDVMF